MTNKCGACRRREGFGMPFGMAFQPMDDLTAGCVHAYEALVRGAEGRGAFEVL